MISATISLSARVLRRVTLRQGVLALGPPQSLCQRGCCDRATGEGLQTLISATISLSARVLRRVGPRFGARLGAATISLSARVLRRDRKRRDVRGSLSRHNLFVSAGAATSISLAAASVCLAATISLSARVLRPSLWW